jgi:hypothetical protein
MTLQVAVAAHPDIEQGWMDGALTFAQGQLSAGAFVTFADLLCAALSPQRAQARVASAGGPDPLWTARTHINRHEGVITHAHH